MEWKLYLKANRKLFLPSSMQVLLGAIVASTKQLVQSKTDTGGMD